MCLFIMIIFVVFIFYLFLRIFVYLYPCPSFKVSVARSIRQSVSFRLVNTSNCAKLSHLHNFLMTPDIELAVRLTFDIRGEGVKCYTERKSQL